MSISKVTRNYQVTIPSDIRKLLHLKVGSLLDFRAVKNNIVIKPKKLVDEEQSYFWSKEWQEEEKKIDEDIKQKKVHSFKNAKDSIKWLKKK